MSNNNINQLENRIRNIINKTTIKIGLYAESRLAPLFQTEGRSLNTYWKPVKTEYLQWKIRNNFSEKILHQKANSNSLVNSFSSSLEGFGHIVVGTPIIYARTHEFGDSNRNIESRPFFKPVSDHITTTNKVEYFFRETVNEI